MDHNYFSKYTQENSEHIEESIVESLETQYEDNIELIQHEQFQINLLLDETKAYKIENIELHNKIKKLSNICKMQFNKIKHLRASLLKYKEEKRKSKRKYKDSQTLHNFLNKDQVSALSQKSTRGSPWSNETIKQSLKLRFACGATGYNELLNQKYPLPALRTLRSKLQGLPFDSGILNVVFDLLKLKVDSMKSSKQKECVLVLDEMSITPGVDYDISSQSSIGNVTLPNHSGIACKALVFMLAGIGSRWKQAVAYYFTSEVVDGSVFQNIINNLISKAESIGLLVNAVTSDMGSCNQAMWKKYEIVVGKYSVTKNYCSHFCDPLRKIFFLPDVPHLFKNIRSALINNKIIKISKDTQLKYNLQSDVVFSKHIELLADHQEHLQLKLAHKLSCNNLAPNHFDKMKVTKATNVLSHEVSTSLKYLVDNEQYDLSLNTTAWFLDVIQKWFKLMTSRHPVLALSKLNLCEYEKTILFLESVIEIFEGLKFGAKGLWKPCQSGVILATTSMLDLKTLFLEEKGYTFLLTSRFSQDCLENLFSCIRTIQPIPSAVQFKTNLKLICVAQFSKFVSNSSYEEDDRQF